MNRFQIVLLGLGVLLLSACGPADSGDEDLSPELSGKSDTIDEYLIGDPVFYPPNQLGGSGVYPLTDDDPGFLVEAVKGKKNVEKTLVLSGTPHLITSTKNKLELSVDGSGFAAGFYLWMRPVRDTAEKRWDDQQGWDPDAEGWKRVMATGVEDFIGSPRKKVIASNFNNVVINLQTNEMKFDYFRPGSEAFYTSLEPGTIADPGQQMEFAFFMVPGKDFWDIEGDYSYTVKLSCE